MVTRALETDRADTVPAPSPAWGRALRRVLQTQVTVIGLLLVILLVLMALTADLWGLKDPSYTSAIAIRKPPGTPGFPLGTDGLGRDILSRVVYGARVSLLISISVVAAGSITGSLLGLIAGYLGGLVDNLIGRVWDVILAFPGLILYLVIIGSLGTGLPMLIAAMTIGGIPGYGRLMRERVLSQRSREYVLAAKALGASEWRIMFTHVLPNSLTPVLVAAALAIPGIILAEAGLSYLGLGVPPEYPSWGKMIADGQNLLELAPWISLIPGFFILLATLGFNLAGDGLRDFLDPTQLR